MSVPDELRRLLGRATLWRAVSLALRPPSADLAPVLRAMAASLDGPEGAELAALAELAGDDLEPLYHRTLGAGGTCPSAESDYAMNTLGAKGGLLGDVAAFYRAFAFAPDRELSEAVDHVSSELSFFAFLHLKEAYARFDGKSEEAATCKTAIDGFFREHLGPALQGVATRLLDQSGDSFYGQAARMALAAADAATAARC